MRQRSRIIHPGFFTNETLAELPPVVRLLFAGLWVVADKSGRLEDRPMRIKLFTLPFDEVDIDGMLQQLHERGFIVRYAENGEKYIQIKNWDKYQSPHWNETESCCPPNTSLDSSYIAPIKLLASSLQVSKRESKSKRKKGGVGENKTANPDHKVAVDYFCQTYKTKLGVPYKFNRSVDGERIRRLLVAYGLETLKRVIDQLFITEDEWIKQAELTIGILELKANKLAQEVSRKVKIRQAKPTEAPEMTEEEKKQADIARKQAVAAFLRPTPTQEEN